jgi:hypothetical protein
MEPNVVTKSVEDLVADLTLVRKKLAEDHDGLFLDLLDTFLIKVKLFGFHFASLDVRQDSRRHDFVWNHILDCGAKSGKTISGADFLKLSQPEQINYLLSLKLDLNALELTDDFVKETLNSIRVIGEIQKENGTTGSHRYVISNCQSALHIIEVFVLGRLLLEQILDWSWMWCRYSKRLTTWRTHHKLWMPYIRLRHIGNISLLVNRIKLSCLVFRMVQRWWLPARQLVYLPSKGKSHGNFT